MFLEEKIFIFHIIMGAENCIIGPDIGKRVTLIAYIGTLLKFWLDCFGRIHFFINKQLRSGHNPQCCFYIQGFLDSQLLHGCLVV